MQTPNKKLPKIGKRGWTGVVIALLGLLTFIGANKQAEDLIQTTWETSGSDRVFVNEALAKAAGHSSYSEYLADKNRGSGMFAMTVGVCLAIWGYNTYGKPKQRSDPPPIPQIKP